MPRNVALNDTLEASTPKGEASCACTTPMRWKRKREKDRGRSIRFSNSNTNYRLPGRPLTRRFVDSPFAISATRDIRAHGYVLVLVVRERGNGIHGHARLSNLDPFQRIARLTRPRSFSSLGVFVGRRATRFGVHQGVDHANLQEATRARDNCLVASRIDFFLSFYFFNELAALLFFFLLRSTNFFPARPLTVDWDVAEQSAVSISASTDSQSNYEESHNEILYTSSAVRK